MLGVHGRDEVLECLAGGPDPRLDAGGEFGVDQAAGGLQLADRVEAAEPRAACSQSWAARMSTVHSAGVRLTSGSRLESLPIR